MPCLRQLSCLALICSLVVTTGCGNTLPDDDDSATVTVTVDNPTAPEPDPITWEDCGGYVGDHPCDFTFSDQDGNDWNLYDHYGDVLLLDFSTMWCYYCKVSAADVQLMQDT